MDPVRDKLLGILNNGADMTIATLRSDKFPQATTVSYVNDGFAIYFACDAGSQKARNVARRPEVSLTINLPYDDWDQIAGVSAAGMCRRVTEPTEIKHFTDIILAKFPIALKFVSKDPSGSLAVFRVDLKVASVLDYAKGFGHTDFVNFAA